MMRKPLPGSTGAPDIRSAYDGSAIVALCVGIAAAAALPLLPAIPAALGVIAVVMALSSRARLKADPQLRGSGISLLAFLLGATAVAVSVWPVAISSLVMLARS